MSQIAFDKNGTAQLYMQAHRMQFCLLSSERVCTLLLKRYRFKICVHVRWRMETGIPSKTGYKKFALRKNREETKLFFLLSLFLSFFRLFSISTIFLLICCCCRCSRRCFFEQRTMKTINEHIGCARSYTLKEFAGQLHRKNKIDKGEIFVFICHKFVFVQLVISLK